MAWTPVKKRFLDYVETSQSPRVLSDLQWIQIGAAGIEKSLFEEVLKSKVIITNYDLQEPNEPELGVMMMAMAMRWNLDTSL